MADPWPTIHDEREVPALAGAGFKFSEMTGREGVLGDLSGDGVAQLRERG